MVYIVLCTIYLSIGISTAFLFIVGGEEQIGALVTLALTCFILRRSELGSVGCTSLSAPPSKLTLAVTTAAFFKIVVAQSCFKQPLFAPARVSRAAPDLASRHR